MIKNKPEDFIIFNSPIDDKNLNYLQEDVEKLGWWYIEKDSCILVDLKTKDNKMVDQTGKDMEISEKDLAKG